MKYLFVLIVSILGLASCKSNNHHNSESINLNDGEKWKVNAAMLTPILEAEKLLDAYIQNNSTDYKTLAKELDEKNQNLISNCTMKGKSHDELHKWLHPHLELVDELMNTKSDEDAKNIVSQLQQSFQNFHTYFN